MHIAIRMNMVRDQTGRSLPVPKAAGGPKMDGSVTVRNWRNEFYGNSEYADYALLPQKDYMTDFYRVGANYTNTLTASGGNDNLVARFSFSDSRNQGITPNHSLNRQYYDLNTQFNSRLIDLGVKVNYMIQRASNRPAQGEYGVMKTLINMPPRSIRLEDLKKSGQSRWVHRKLDRSQ